MPDLPRIACFHGSGSNKKVFEIQCGQLELLLKDDFKFVFFDGPFDRAAGPGVLPAFEDYEPFKTWFKINGDGTVINDGSGYDETGRDGIERVKGLMTEMKGGEWVAAMGFSSGSRVAAGLLLDQQRRVKDNSPNNLIDLKFGVLCMGGKEPMNKMPEDRSNLELIRIPTLHVHGLKDQFLSYSKEQYATYFDPATAKLYAINYHHAMPWKPVEVENLAALIKDVYRDSMSRRSR